jgi:hypothetical protein
MEPLSILGGVLAIPIAMIGIALLQGEEESVRELFRWIYNKVRK